MPVKNGGGDTAEIQGMSHIGPQWLLRNHKCDHRMGSITLIYGGKWGYGKLYGLLRSQ